MGFDFAAGVSQNQVNQVAATVFAQVYPAYFKGSLDVPSVSMRVDYDVSRSPVFNLKPLTSAQRQELVDAIGQEAGAGKAGQRLIVSAVEAAAAFMMDLPEIKIGLTSTSDQKRTELTLSGRVICQAQVSASDGQVALTILKLTLPPVEDKTVQFILDHVVTPQLQEQINQYLKGVRLPALNLDGVELSVPLVLIQDNRLIALTTLRGRGTPSPDSFSWPGENFFTILSPDLLTAAAQIAVRKLNPEFHDHGEASTSIGIGTVGVNWHYDFSLNSPRIALLGTNQAISFQSSGGAGAGVYLDVPIIGRRSVDLGVHFQADPNPSGEVRFAVDPGNNVVLTVDQVHALGLKIGLDNVPGWLNEVLGWVTKTITSGITGSLVPLVNSFIQGLNVSVYRIPEILINQGVIRLKVAASDIRVTNLNNDLAVVGNLNVTKQPRTQLDEALDQVAAGRE